MSQYVTPKKSASSAAEGLVWSSPAAQREEQRKRIVHLIRQFGSQLGAVEKFLLKGDAPVYERIAEVDRLILSQLKGQEDYYGAFSKVPAIAERIQNLRFPGIKDGEALVGKMILQAAYHLYDVERMCWQQNIVVPPPLALRWEKHIKEQSSIASYLYRALDGYETDRYNIPPEVYDRLFSTATVYLPLEGSRVQPLSWGILVLSWMSHFQDNSTVQRVGNRFLRAYGNKDKIRQIESLTTPFKKVDRSSFRLYVSMWTVHVLEMRLRFKFSDRVANKLIEHFKDEVVRQEVSFMLAHLQDLQTRPLRVGRPRQDLLLRLRVLFNLIYTRCTPHQRSNEQVMESMVGWVMEADLTRMGTIKSHAYPPFHDHVVNKLPKKQFEIEQFIQLVKELETCCLDKEGNGEEFRKGALGLLMLMIDSEGLAARYFSLAKSYCSMSKLIVLTPDLLVDFFTQHGEKNSKDTFAEMEEDFGKRYRSKEITLDQLIKDYERRGLKEFELTAMSMREFCKRQLATVSSAEAAFKFYRETESSWIEERRAFLEAIVANLPENLTKPSEQIFRLVCQRHLSSLEERKKWIKRFAQLTASSAEEEVNSDLYLQGLSASLSGGLNAGIEKTFALYKKVDPQLSTNLKVRLFLEQSVSIPLNPSEEYVEALGHFLSELQKRYRLSSYQHLHLFYIFLSRSESRNNVIVLRDMMRFIQYFDRFLGEKLSPESLYSFLLLQKDLSVCWLGQYLKMLDQSRQQVSATEIDRLILCPKVIANIKEALTLLTGPQEEGVMHSQLNSAFLFPDVSYLTRNFAFEIRDQRVSPQESVQSSLTPLTPKIPSLRLALSEWKTDRDGFPVFCFSILKTKSLDTYSVQARFPIKFDELQFNPGFLKVLKEICEMTCSDLQEIDEAAYDEYSQGGKQIKNIDDFLKHYPKAKNIWDEYNIKFIPFKKGRNGEAVFEFLSQLKIGQRKAIISLATENNKFLPEIVETDDLLEIASKEHVFVQDGAISIVPFDKLSSYDDLLFQCFTVSEPISEILEVLHTGQGIKIVNTTLNVTNDFIKFEEPTPKVCITYMQPMNESKQRGPGQQKTAQSTLIFRAKCKNGDIEASVKFSEAVFNTQKKMSQLLRWNMARLKSRYYKVLQASREVSSEEPFKAPQRYYEFSEMKGV